MEPDRTDRRFSCAPQHQRGAAGPAPCAGGRGWSAAMTAKRFVCIHTMDGHSLARHWPVIVSRLAKTGLAIVPRPGSETGTARGSENPAGD